jgi:multiple sugar transport system permease protein
MNMEIEATAAARRPRLSARRKHQFAGWLFLTPAIAYLLFAFALPIVYNVMLSFEQTSPATIANFTAPFAGLDNYRFILNDPTSREAIVRTFEFTFLSLLFQFIIGFALALLFSLRFPGRTFARSLVIVPWLLPLIVTGVIFRFLFQAEGGAINQVLTTVGLTDHPIQWLNDPHLAFWTILVGNIWLGIPFFTTARSRTCRWRSRKPPPSTAPAPGKGFASSSCRSSSRSSRSRCSSGSCSP